jgi:hypothetical protein
MEHVIKVPLIHASQSHRAGLSRWLARLLTNGKESEGRYRDSHS